ncbi:MAG: DUF3391 domain-containing protein [Nitrospirae bacterium]|nr:DUF3391 domain-containing protein [Nitrospirota bacterium]
MIKRISIDQLTAWMFVTKVDQSWLKTPFWIHRRLIKTKEEIHHFKDSGVEFVYIDTALGLDLEHDSTPADVLTSCADNVPDLERSESPCLIESHPEGSVSQIQEEGLSSYPGPLRSFKEELADAREIRKETICTVQQIFDGIKTGVPIKMDSLRKVAETLIQSLVGRESPMLTEIQLSRMKQYDHSLYIHSVDVCVLSIIVGAEGKLTKAQLQDLAVGALLHDVGQIRLPRNLFVKVGTFTEQERKLWRAHSQLGAKVVGECDMVSYPVRRIVTEHHERVDGSGYPWEKSGTQISSLAQLVGLVDRYEALISTRGYRPATPPALAVRRIYQLGIQGEFAMDWVERLIRCFSIYPVGSLVELNTGERGWVVSINSADRMCPTVKLLWDKEHQKLFEPITIELSGLQDHSPERKIQRVLNPKIEGVTEEFSCSL